MAIQLLLAIFFLFIGLEIAATIAHPKALIIPSAAALSGMVFPALIFLAISPSTHLWAAAMPTDLAIALGGLALVGKGIRPQVRTFLLLLAVADDFFSLLIFGAIYGSKLHLADSLSTLGAALLGFTLGQIKIIQPARLIQVLNPLTTFFIVPVYVIYQVRSGFSTEITNGTTLGFLAARVVGKVLGIALFIWIAHRRNWINAGSGISLNESVGVGLLAGSAMTVSLVIGEIAAQSPGEMDQLRSGVFLSAIISVILGSVWLRLRGRVHASE